MTDAITRPGELWHGSLHNQTEVAVIRYRDEGGYYRVPVANFATARDAACAIQGHNFLIEIAELYQQSMQPHLRDDRVRAALRKYGR